MDTSFPSTRPRIATIKQAASQPEYGWLSEGAWRHLVFNALPRRNSKGEALPTNGLSDCGAIIKIGRKVLVDLDAFDRWVSRHRATSGEK